MKIGFDMGHTLSGLGTGAQKIVKETDINRQVGNLVIKYLQQLGETVINCTVDYSSNDLKDRVTIANRNNVDLFVSLHLNAGGGKGTETYIYSGSYVRKEDNRAKAKKVNDALTSLGFTNRGVKEANFQVLRDTMAQAYLIELFFVDSQTDVDLYNKLGADKIARTLAEAISGKKLNSISQTTQPSVNPAPNKEIFRIRKNWGQVTTQIGAYSNLNNAIAECKKYSGYSVYNSAGVKVYPVESISTSCDAELKRYSENGKFTTTASSIIFRDKPCTCHGINKGSYYKGESVYYDLVVITNKYTWISWIGRSGERRYMPITDRKANEKWGYCV